MPIRKLKQKPLCDERTMSIWVARFIPLLLIGLVGYATWVVIDLLAVKHLLRPTPLAQRGAGIAIIVVYLALLLPMAVCFSRLLYAVIMTPGLCPRGSMDEEAQKERALWASPVPPEKEKPGHGAGADGGGGATEGEKEAAAEQGRFLSRGHVPASPGSPHSGSRPDAAAGRKGRRRRYYEADLQDFYGKQVYACQGNGLPPWCSHCQNWKPDRAHHCSQLDRCVLRLDHFCPWIGGVVSETSFKFFVQFLAYSTLYCAFVLTVTANYIAKGVREAKPWDSHWAIVLGLAGFFLIFTSTMAGNSIYFTLKNLTTIENLSWKTTVWHFAVRRRPGDPGSGQLTAHYPPLPPRPPLSTAGILPEEAGAGTPASRALPPIAVFSTKQGENPWDLGLLNNWKSVMGDRVVDWFLPIKHSPMCRHDGEMSAYHLGQAVRILKES